MEGFQIEINSLAFDTRGSRNLSDEVMRPPCLQSHFPRDLADLVTRASQLAYRPHGEVDFVRRGWLKQERGEASRYSDNCKWNFFSPHVENSPALHRLYPAWPGENDDDSGANFICILPLRILGASRQMRREYDLTMWGCILQMFTRSAIVFPLHRSLLLTYRHVKSLSAYSVHIIDAETKIGLELSHPTTSTMDENSKF